MSFNDVVDKVHELAQIIYDWAKPHLESDGFIDKVSEKRPEWESFLRLNTGLIAEDQIAALRTVAELAAIDRLLNAKKEEHSAVIAKAQWN